MESRGGAGGGTANGKVEGGGTGEENELMEASCGNHGTVWAKQEFTSASGGGGGNVGEAGNGDRSMTSAGGGGGGGGGESSGQCGGGVGRGCGGGGAPESRGELRVGSNFFTLTLPSVDVFEEREVEDEDMETEERREDFLSGTLGFSLDFPFPDDADFKNTGTGVSAVGVLDWLEYPLDGDVTRWDFSGEVLFGLASPPGTCGTEALEPSLKWLML